MWGVKRDCKSKVKGKESVSCIKVSEWLIDGGKGEQEVNSR